MAGDSPKMGLELALRELEEHWRDGEPGRPDVSKLTRDKGKQYLPAGEIKRRVAVFQPRSLIGQKAEEHVVLEELQAALKRNGVEHMDPVAVWWSGKAFFCVDGHHRLLAIMRHNRDLEKKTHRNVKAQREMRQKVLKVPVTILFGTLSEAIEWSTRENGKARISLRKHDRSNWAWKTACLHWSGIVEGKFVLSQRCKSLHVSERLLYQMHSSFKKIASRQPEGRGPEEDREFYLGLADLNWPSVQRLAEDGDITPEPWDDDRRRDEVERLTRKLISVLGAHSFSTPRAELVAEALSEASSRFWGLALGSPTVNAAVLETLRMSAAEDLWDDLEDDPEED